MEADPRAGPHMDVDASAEDMKVDAGEMESVIGFCESMGGFVKSATRGAQRRGGGRREARRGQTMEADDRALQAAAHDAQAQFRPRLPQPAQGEPDREGMRV